MKYRFVLFPLLVIVLLGAAVAGGTLLGRSLSADLQSAPSAQTVEGRFPLDFQGILLDGEGNPVSNGGHSLSFSIYDRESGSGGRLWGETQTVFTLDGLFTAQLGAREDIDPSIFSENLETYLGIRVGNDPELTPRIRLDYAPYAMHALTADVALEPPLNTRRIALQRWYEANQTAVSVAVDDSPGQVLYDGQFIWVTTRGDDDETNDDNVTKINPVDGSKLLEIDVPQVPTDMVYDGRNIWVSLSETNQLMTFRSDGSRRITRLPFNDSGNFVELNRPTRMVFDGMHIWVVNQGNATLSKIRVEDSEIVPIIGGGTFELNLGGTISDLAFDGENIWVGHTGTQNITLIKALTVPASPDDDEFMRSFAIGNGEDALAFDGTHMWIVDRAGRTVTKVRVSDMEEIGEFDTGNTPVDIAFDGRAMWIVNQAGNNVTKLRVSDGESLGSFVVGRRPVSIAFDGVNMWISNSDDNTVVMR
jgi:hypothetical protein